MLERGRKLKSNLVEHRTDGVTAITATYRKIPMTILVDTVDWPLVEPYYWYIDRIKRGRFYAVTGTGQWSAKGTKKLFMHRIFLPDAPIVDHENHDTLDYRRENLRPATYQQNNRNTSKTSSKTTSRFLGVSWDKSRQRWVTGYKVNGVRHVIGRFADEDQAAHARDSKVLEVFGEFASLNFPKEEYKKNDGGTWSWIEK